MFLICREWLRGRLGRNSLPNVQNFSLCSAKGEVFPYMFPTESKNPNYFFPKLEKLLPVLTT
jgi:hypothetical protein